MLEANCITKSYGSTRANNCLTMSVGRGEIVGILGENGAGKSTFLSIMAGQSFPDSGHILLDGRPVRIGSPRDALELGISLVFQHFSLVPTFTIREQLRLSGWESPHLPDLLASRFSGDEIIGLLSPGERQIVEIARALVPEPRFLLLDEPTSILTESETQNLFSILRHLRECGTSVVLVTHKLHEVMAVCDRIVVIRQGRAVDELARAASGWPPHGESRLLAAMFGSRAAGETPARRRPRSHHQRQQSSSRLHLHNVQTRGPASRTALHDIALDLPEGEIGAIVGVDGQGQRELAEVCAGARKATGIIEVDGSALTSGDARAFKLAGVACLTGDRMGEGVVPGFSVESNLILKRQREGPFSCKGIFRRREIRKYAQDIIDDWGVVPPHATAPISSLSGGNIQKVLLARELSIASSVLVVTNPSAGLDARTRDYVWSAIHQFANDGGSVLLFNHDLPEAFEHADRIGVMYEGRLSTMEDIPGVNRDALERLMVTGWN